MSKAHNRMNDPFYAQLLFQVEQIICQADTEAKKQNIKLTDSLIKSVLNKTQHCLMGRDSTIQATAPREIILRDLVHSLVHAPEYLDQATTTEDGTERVEPLGTREWINAIECAEESLKIHKGQTPGGRDYLDFLQEFIADAKALQRDEEK